MRYQIIINQEFLRRYLFLIMILFISTNSTAQNLSDQQKVSANFELAERFTTQKMDKLIGSISVYPRWIKDSDNFWYTYETAEG